MGKSIVPVAPFVGGLNTEANQLTNAVQFTKDESNMLIRANQTRCRRPGVDYEELYKFCNETLDTGLKDLAFNAIEWTDANQPEEANIYDTTPYIVVQAGGKLLFFKNLGLPYSQEQQEFTVDLQEYALDPESDLYKRERCKFTAAYGSLFVTSNAIKPFVLKTVEPAEDEPVLDQKPCVGILSCSIPNSKKGRMAGYGWAQFYINDIAVGPQLNTSTFYGRVGNCSSGPWMVSSTQLAQWWNDIPAEQRRNIVATPKHTNAYATRWGLNVDQRDASGYTPQDYITLTAPEGEYRRYKGLKISLKMSGMHQSRKKSWTSTYNYFTNLAGGSSYTQKRGLELTIRDHVGATDYLEISDNPEKLSYAHLYNLLNQGWTPTLIAKYYNAQTPLKVFPARNLAQQYLKDSKTTEFKPTATLYTTFGNTPAPTGHHILSFFEQDRVEASVLDAAFDNVVAEIRKLGTQITKDDIIDKDFPVQWDDPYAQVPTIRPRKQYVADICTYAGRIFYLCGDILLYSKIISEDTDKADECYSDADPTSEEISDVIETDGGMISLPEIGEGIRLAQVGPDLVVLGTRDNVVIGGTANNIFTATAYSQSSLNSIPTVAPYSLVETEYGLFYWGSTGIIAVGLTENGVVAQDISSQTILTFYDKISQEQQKYCKGVYSAATKKVYWFYPEDVENPRSLNLCLVYDIMRQAYTTLKIANKSDREDQDYSGIVPEIVGAVKLKVPFKSVKEYPVYVDRIVPADTHELLYIKAEPTQGWKDSEYTGDIYYNPETSTNAYADPDLSVVLGPLSNFFGNRVIKTAYHTVLRQTQGSDKVVISKPWESLTGVSQALYMSLSDSTHFINGTPTDAEDSRLYSNLDTDEQVYEDGIIKYRSVVFSEDNLEDAQLNQYTVTYSGILTGSEEVVDDEGRKILADTPLDTEMSTYESSILICLDPANAKITFGDFLNNNYKDWAEGDQEGEGYNYDSYLISHPISNEDFMRNKTMPYLHSYFKRTETGKDLKGNYIYGSKCQGSVLWDWRTNGTNGKWDSPQELYRPNPRTLLSEGYVITKSNIRGIGRAFQVKLSSVDNNNFIVEALSFNLQNDERF